MKKEFHETARCAKIVDPDGSWSKAVDGKWFEIKRDIVTITIGRVVEQGGLTIWNSNLEVCSQIKFAQIAEGYYTTYDEGVKIEEKRAQRFARCANLPSPDLSDAYKMIALRWIQCKPRMKSCQLKDIKRMTRIIDGCGRNRYRITAKGKDFTIR